MTTEAFDFGDFAVFGVTEDAEFLSQELPRRLGITPQTIDFGSAGTFFYYNSYGEVGESEEAISLKLGFIRSRQREFLSAQQLLDQKIVGAGTIDSQAMYGSATIGSFSKVSPKFSVYESLLVSPPLYYTQLRKDSFLCATNIRALLAMLDRVEFNDEAIPMHFLFESVVGPISYFRDIFRVFPGQRLTWDQGKVKVELVQNFQPPKDMPRYNQLSEASVAALEQDMGTVLKAYLAEIEQSGHQSANLLSGGVDSSVLQLLLNQQTPSPRSFSYAVRASSFEFEVEYARHASELFKTDHTYFDIMPQDFPQMLIRTIEAMGQPSLMFEGEVGKLALAEALTAQAPDTRYFFTAQGADGLHGMAPAKKMILFDRVNRIPGGQMGMGILSSLVSVVSPHRGHGLGEVAQMLAEDKDPTSFQSPMNIAGIATHVDTLRKYFGDKPLLDVFEYRNNMEKEYLNSPLMVEKTQIVDLLTASYEPAMVGEQVFASKGKRIVQLFLDEEIMLGSFAIDPGVRYTKGLITKPFLKEMLVRHGFSDLAYKPKGASVFREDLYSWMKKGPLEDLIQDIDLPDFVTQKEFDKMIDDRDKMVWNLLTLDLFQKRILKDSAWKKVPAS